MSEKWEMIDAKLAQFSHDPLAELGLEGSLRVEDSKSNMAETGLGLGIAISSDTNADGSWRVVERSLSVGDKGFHRMIVEPLPCTSSISKPDTWRTTWAKDDDHDDDDVDVAVGEGRMISIDCCVF